MRPWRIVDTVQTPEGVLQIRQRGDDDFLMTIAGRVLMSRMAHRSEDALAEATCGLPGAPKRPRVLLGGLGMGFTLRAALDRLPPDAKVDVVEINPAVVEWCRGVLAPLTRGAIADPRVKVHVADVARFIARARPGTYHSILLDLYEGPHQALNPESDRLYGNKALANVWSALREGGVFGVWSEEPDQAFARRLTAAGFRTATHRPTRGGRTHTIYVDTKITSRPRQGR